MPKTVMLVVISRFCCVHLDALGCDALQAGSLARSSFESLMTEAGKRLMDVRDRDALMNIDWDEVLSFFTEVYSDASKVFDG